jgi:hypothetical protein
MHCKNNNTAWVVGQGGIIYKTKTLFNTENQLSVENDMDGYRIKIFPNPATDKISIHFSSINNVSFKLIDIAGNIYKRVLYIQGIILILVV